jgi:hypothetical protein
MPDFQRLTKLIVKHALGRGYLSEMPVQCGFIVQATDSGCFYVFHRRQHGSRAPDLNATYRVFSCDLEMAQMEERRCGNVAGSYYECRVILFPCQ